MRLKKAAWFTLGIILLIVAYLGVILPGIPWSTPTVFAAICFAKSSDRMHAWLYNHKRFGPFLRNWNEKRVFPTRAKYLMLVTMVSSLAIMWLTTGNLTAILASSCFMIVVAIWGWRYPGSVEEHDRRVSSGEKVAWLR